MRPAKKTTTDNTDYTEKEKPLMEGGAPSPPYSSI
jgi:hypothetical protein